MTPVSEKTRFGCNSNCKKVFTGSVVGAAQVVPFGAAQNVIPLFTRMPSCWASGPVLKLNVVEELTSSFALDTVDAIVAPV